MKSTWKGERRYVATRVPVALAEVLEQRAAAAGLTTSEFLAQQLAASLLPQPEEQALTPAA